MYLEEDFDEAFVEFEEEAAVPGAAGPSPAAATPAAVPLPLEDAELDAYLADDEPAAQQQDTLPVIDDAAAPVQQGSSTLSDADANAAVRRSADAPQPGTDDEEEDEEEVLAAPNSSHSIAQEPYAAVVLTAQPAFNAPASDSPARQSSSPGSSRHVSTGGQQLQEQWQPASPATAHSPAAQDAHASTQSSILQDSIGSPIQHRARPRPASASPAIRRSSSACNSNEEQRQCFSPSSSRRSHQHQHQQQQSLDVLPVANWTVNDVCDWVDGLGLTQYRKKFMHHVVHGHLLLRLTDTLLRTELAIGPLGHRTLILDGIQAVAAADLQQAASAALAGTSPEDYQGASGCSSPSAAAAVLVAGLIALKAGGQRGASSRSASPFLPRAGSGSMGGSPVNTAAAAAAAAAGSPNRGSGASPVARRVRPFSAPCKGKGGQRPASPGAGRGSTSPGALGPAAGRISVYKQRAKILFELGRAQARAAATAGTANEVTGIAQLAQREVAMLQGQLADLDKKNKLAVQHAGGSVDSRGVIPWHHVGNGTNAANPHPERLARPWDSSEVELTFQPRISARSQQLMAEARGSEGAGGFLDRLDSDMRRREAKQKELEKRYYANSAAADATAAAAKTAAADLATLAAFFSQRGWATLTVPGSSDGEKGGAKQLSEADYRELDGQLDEVVESYSGELGLGKSDSRHSHAIVAAHGPKKLAAMVAAVRTVQFMDRYHSDLSTRGNRLQQLQDSYFKAPAVSPGPGRRAVVPLTKEQQDLAQAVRWFRGMGWQEAEEQDGCDDLLGALVARARHYKAEAEKLHEKERAAATAAGGHAAAAHCPVLPYPAINWAAAPWSVDGLGPLMQTILDARKAAAEAAAADRAAAAKPTAAGTAPACKEAPAAAAASAATLEAAAASGADTLELSVRLLAGMRWAGLDQLDAASGKAKKLALYRALRTQQFLAFTASDLAKREVKQKALLQEFEASRRGKLVSQAELDDFYTRLQADGVRRQSELEKARQDKADREAKALALVSVGPGFSRRPRSAK